MKNWPTKHHIIARNGNDIKGSNHPDNIVELKRNYHRQLHTVFGNDTPKEQIERLFNINYTCLADWIKSDIIKILDHKDLEYFYKYWTYRK